jgi:hypothetical protein
MIGYVSVRKLLLSGYNQTPKNPMLEHFTLTACQGLREKMSASVRFNIGESLDSFCSGSVGTPIFEGSSRPEFFVPFPLMWVEGTIANEDGRRIPTATLVEAGVAKEKGLMWVNSTVCLKEETRKQWDVFPVVHHFIPDMGQSKMIFYGTRHEEEYSTDVKKEADDIIDKFLTEFLAPPLTVVNALFLLLQCRNVITEEVIPSKSQKRRSKKPLLSYHILKIKPSKSNPLRDNTPLGGENRVHLCRGHFKTYTAERPLMGRFVGRYWWQPQARGRAKGIVLKDYEV